MVHYKFYKVSLLNQVAGSVTYFPRIIIGNLDIKSTYSLLVHVKDIESWFFSEFNSQRYNAFIFNKERYGLEIDFYLNCLTTLILLSSIPTVPIATFWQVYCFICRLVYILITFLGMFALRLDVRKQTCCFCLWIPFLTFIHFNTVWNIKIYHWKTCKIVAVSLFIVWIFVYALINKVAFVLFI